jgi:hypothetical protein
VREVDSLVVAGCFVAIEAEDLPLLQHCLVAAELADAKLRPLQVRDDRRRPLQILLQRADDLDQPAVVVMRAVAHVDAECIGAGLREPADHLGRIAGGPERRKDANLSATGHELAGHGAFRRQS